MVKEIINKMKTQPTKWVNIFANHLSDKQLTSKTHATQYEKKKVIQFKNGQKI